MAWDPCVTCGREFHGSTAFTYVTWHTGEQKHAFRLRQCTECAADLRTGVSGTADARDENGNWNALQERRDPPPEKDRRRSGGEHQVARASVNGAVQSR